jgi:hypothetical protein
MHWHFKTSSRARRLVSHIMMVGSIAVISSCASGDSNTGAAELQGRPDGLAKGLEHNRWDTGRYIRQVDFLENRARSSVEVKFPCKENQCGKQDSVRFRLIAARGMAGHRWREAIDSKGENGQIVAKFVNLDNVPYEPFGMKANGVAYLWVGHVPGKAGFPALYHVSKRIDMPRARRLVSFEEWGECNDRPDSPETEIAVRAPNEVKCLTRGIPAGAVWVSCSGGCCEARTAEPDV